MMPIREINGQLCFVRFELSSDEIPELLEWHTKKYPGVGNLETTGAALVASSFEVEASKDFLREVYKWGGGLRNLSRVEQSSSDEIASALSESIDLARNGKVAEGVARLQQLKQVGQSFASKLMRFLEPSRAVILDSVIRNHIGYTETTKGYTDFLNDCYDVLISIRRSDRFKNTSDEALRVCDIEAAIFAKLQGFQNVRS